MEVGRDMDTPRTNQIRRGNDGGGNFKNRRTPDAGPKKILGWKKDGDYLLRVDLMRDSPLCPRKEVWDLNGGTRRGKISQGYFKGELEV